MYLWPRKYRMNAVLLSILFSFKLFLKITFGPFLFLALLVFWQIEGVDPDNGRVVVKLAIGGKTVTIIQHSIKLVTRKEYDKYSKDLSKSILKSSSDLCVQLEHCHGTINEWI